MKTGTIPVLIGCQIPGCADEVSYPLDMMRMYNAAPICERCYAEVISVYADWDELPNISLSDLDFGSQFKPFPALTTGDPDV